MRNRVQVCVALLLLLGAATDLLVPGVCNVEDIPTLPHGHAAISDPHRDMSSRPDVAAAWGDDCFCCCAHVVTRRFVEVLPAVASVDTTNLPLPSLVNGPPDRVLHPPQK